jgi:hypothetical protein
MNDPAQSTVPGSDNQTQTAPGEAQTQDDGQTRLNQRFAELTQIINSQKDLLAQSQTLAQQLMANQAALQAQLAQVHQPRQEPAQPFQIQLPEGTDPALAQVFNGMTQAFQKTLEEQHKRTEALISQAVGGVRQSQEQMEMSQAVAGQPKEVQELANRLYQQWRQAGHTGWVPRDAVTFARGQLGVTAAPGHRQAQQEITAPGGAPPPPARGQELPPPLPDEVLKKMSLKQQEDYWFKRVGDSPLEY